MTLKTFHFAGVASMSILYILIIFIFIQEKNNIFKFPTPPLPSQKNNQTKKNERFGKIVRHYIDSKEFTCKCRS